MAREVSRLLDEEHQTTLDLLDVVERVVARAPTAGAPPDPELARVMQKLERHLVLDVPRHFAFEEEAVFPALVDAGEGDLCALLSEEHVGINAVIGELVPLAAAPAALDGAGLAALRRAAQELAERLRSHIDKETMALLPVCNDVFDDDTDQRLAFGYASA